MIDLKDFIARHPVVPYIRKAGYDTRNPWYVPDSKLLDYLLVYVQEGHCVFHVNGEKYALGKGEFCFIHPDEPITLRGTTQTVTPFIHMDIFYNPHRSETFPPIIGLSNLHTYARLLQPRLNDFAGLHIPVRIQPAQPEKFLKLLVEAISHWESGACTGPIASQQAATELVLALIEQYGEFPQPPNRNPSDLNWIASYLAFHLSDDISVNDMASWVNMSPSRFASAFRQTFGTPPYQYLLSLRIRHAEELLRSTSLNLDQIAEYCGFADAQHLSKMFRKIKSRSPGAVRSMVSS